MSSFYARLFHRLLFKPVVRRYPVRSTYARTRPSVTPLVGAVLLGSFGLFSMGTDSEAEKDIEKRKNKYAQAFKAAFESQGLTSNVKVLKKEVLIAGDGVTKPQDNQYVQLNYTCFVRFAFASSNSQFLDGTEFDSSRPAGENRRTFEFKIGDDLVVDGLEKGVKSMTVGERAWILVPPHLGFGDKELSAHGKTIPAGAHLVFDVMLLGVSNKPKYDKGYEDSDSAN